MKKFVLKYHEKSGKCSICGKEASAYLGRGVYLCREHGIELKNYINRALREIEGDFRTTVVVLQTPNSFAMKRIFENKLVRYVDSLSAVIDLLVKLEEHVSAILLTIVENTNEAFEFAVMDIIMHMQTVTLVFNWYAFFTDLKGKKKEWTARVEFADGRIREIKRKFNEPVTRSFAILSTKIVYLAGQKIKDIKVW